jgi:hypothetical protein
MLAAALLAALLASAPRVARGGDWGLTDVYEARRRVSRPSRSRLPRAPAVFTALRAALTLAGRLSRRTSCWSTTASSRAT